MGHFRTYSKVLFQRHYFTCQQRFLLSCSKSISSSSVDSGFIFYSVCYYVVSLSDYSPSPWLHHVLNQSTFVSISVKVLPSLDGVSQSFACPLRNVPSPPPPSSPDDVIWGLWVPSVFFQTFQGGVRPVLCIETITWSMSQKFNACDKFPKDLTHGICHLINCRLDNKLLRHNMQRVINKLTKDISARLFS